MIKGKINYRPICVFALAEATGIWVTSLFLDNTGALLLFVALALVLSGILLLSKLNKYIFIPVAFALGIFLLSGVYGVYNANKIKIPAAEITATISSEITQHDNYFYFEVENVTANGQKLKKSATVFTYYLPEERAGDEIKIRGDISSYDFDIEGYFLYSYRNGVCYKIYPDSIEGLGEGKLKPTTEIRVKMKRLLYNNANESTANIASALIFGDKSGIDESLYDDVKDSGLSHIFAVSGLHVGILASLFFFLAKILKFKGFFKILFVMIIPTLYGLICGFPASVMRALIMTFVFLLADVSGRQKDGLNSLALAAIIVLTLFPTDLFTLGFQMSFAAIIGLIVISPSIKKPFDFFPKGIKEIIVASLSVNIMLWPIMSKAFGKVQILFIVANLLILPILPFMYLISLIICVFAYTIPSAAVVLTVLNVVLWPIKAVSFIIGSLSISSVTAVGIGFAAIAYYFAIIINSNFVFIKHRSKLKISLVTAAVAICLLLI